MHGKAMNPNEHVHSEDVLERAEEALDAKIVQALEARPEVLIPAGFAARVASQVRAPRPAVRRAVLLRPTYYGLKTMAASLVALAVMLIALLTNHTGHTAIGMTVEWIIYVQLLAFAIWLSLRRAGIRWSFWSYRAGSK